MFYTGVDPFTGKKIYTATDYHEKQMQRALLQYNRPQNADLVREALRRLGRDDLIGFGPECLVKPGRIYGAKKQTGTAVKSGSKPARQRGNAKANGKPRGGISDRTASRSPSKRKADARKRSNKAKKR